MNKYRLRKTLSNYFSRKYKSKGLPYIDKGIDLDSFTENLSDIEIEDIVCVFDILEGILLITLDEIHLFSSTGKSLYAPIRTVSDLRLKEDFKQNILKSKTILICHEKGVMEATFRDSMTMTKRLSALLYLLNVANPNWYPPTNWS